MIPTYKEILTAAKSKDDDVQLLCKVGSQVYGTATPDSDHDFVLVLNEAFPRKRLLSARVRLPRLNITVVGSEDFNHSIKDGSIFFLECAFAPGDAVLKRTKDPLRSLAPSALPLVGLSATERATSDFVKGLKTQDPKRVYHALRVLTFALQIFEKGKIYDFSVAKEIYEEVMTEPLSLQEPFTQSFEDKLALLKQLSKRTSHAHV